MSERLSHTMEVALQDCADWPKGTYRWKLASMRKLAKMGLVKLVGDAYQLTEAGADKVRELGGKVRPNAL